MEHDHLTQREVAENLGVHVRSVQNWLAGVGPSKRHRRVIAAWLDARKFEEAA